MVRFKLFKESLQLIKAGARTIWGKKLGDLSSGSVEVDGGLKGNGGSELGKGEIQV